MPMPPENPENFDKVNFVIDMWCRPCQAPWYIYLETLKPAALEAFIVLISFGWADVLRGVLRPKGLGRRTKKKKKGPKSKGFHFGDTGNTIGKNLPFGEQVSEWIEWKSNTKLLWRIDNAMQAGLFMWLVADVAEDFVFNWTSLLYKTYWCRESHLGRFSYRNIPTPNKSGGSWWTEAFGTEDYEDGPPWWGFQSGRTGANGATIASAVTFTTLPPYDPPTECSVRIVNMDGFLIIKQEDATQPDADGVFRIPIMQRTDEDIIFRVQSRHNSAWASVGNGVVVGTENEAH